MVDALKSAQFALYLATLIGILCAALACGPRPPTVVPPTPTPVPDAATLLAETAANVRSVQSANFHLTHEMGAIYLPDFRARVTEVAGAWDADAGADLSIDAYLVSHPDADPETGSYVQVNVIFTPDGYYSTEPISGLWLKQPVASALVSVDALQHMIADLIGAVENPELAGEETLDGVATYRIGGDVPASAMDWLPIRASDGQLLRVEIWTDQSKRVLRRLDAVGAIGEFDLPDTHRTIVLTDTDEPVTIATPEHFIDLTGG